MAVACLTCVSLVACRSGIPSATLHGDAGTAGDARYAVDARPNTDGMGNEVAAGDAASHDAVADGMLVGEAGTVDGGDADASPGSPDGGLAAEAGPADSGPAPDPCAQVTCDHPPAAICVAGALRTYGAGTCTGGVCSYASSDVPCEHGCAAGACCAGWSFTVIEPEPYSGSFVSLTSSPDGALHTVFQVANAMRYAVRPSGGGWTQYPVSPDDPPGSWGANACLALTATAEPRVFATAQGAAMPDTTVYYFPFAPNDLSWWYGIEIDLGHAYEGFPTAYVIDSTGHHRLFYHSPSGGADLVAYHQYEQALNPWWETVDSEGDVGSQAAAVVGPGGTVYVAYYDATNARVRLATSNAMSSYDLSTIGPGYSADLALDASSKLHAAYNDPAGQVLHAYRSTTGSTWTRETVASYGDTPAVAVDSAGTVHIVFEERYAYSCQLKHARRTGSSSFSVEVLDECQPSINGKNFDLVVTPDRHLHVVYAHETGTRHAELAPCEG